MEDTVFVGFTSYCNELWISFGPPKRKEVCGHEIRWEVETSSGMREFPVVQAAVQLRQRIIIRTGQTPSVQNASMDNVLLQLVQLALKNNLL